MTINNSTDSSLPFYSKLEKWVIDVLPGIRLKLSVVTFLLVALTTTASSIIVINIMDRFIQGELYRHLGVACEPVHPVLHTALHDKPVVAVRDAI